jgi:hypothetical protein
MTTSVLFALWISATSMGATIPERDVQHQNRVFQEHWGTDFVWRFDDLPAKGGVTSDRVPYSGFIYPDRSGGTISAMSAYDRAFHGGRSLATAWEQWDNNVYQQPVTQVGGFFGRRQISTMGIPSWHGHCNGWAAAAIRHAEPERSVTRNGVVFSPATIKGLLAELYIYNGYEDLSGSSQNIEAGVLHAVVANWLGRGRHPLGMEADPGKQKWNYPAYAFSSSSARLNDRQVEVRLNLAYARDSQGEYQRSPRIQGIRSFHYRLDLNERGEIIGGVFYRGSTRIAMLWLPLQPKPPGTPGHERGNPHVNVREVLSIWRESVPEETRSQWLVVDPAPEDRHVASVDMDGLVPVVYIQADDGDSPGAEAVPDPQELANESAAIEVDAPAASD